MGKCVKCSSILGEGVEICPICGADQSTGDFVEIPNVDNKLTSGPSILSQELIESEEQDRKLEVDRLIKRGDECFNSGKAWLGAKDRSRARKDFQRAFNYYETALKILPDNERVREMRAKCLFKMA
jgi:tetratricopeptide (TPR) repeat protein